MVFGMAGLAVPMASGSCKPCPPTCQSCSDGNTCDECEPGRKGKSDQHHTAQNTTESPGAYLSPNHSCTVVCDDGYYKEDLLPEHLSAQCRSVKIHWPFCCIRKDLLV